jgi:hypothetical protein
MVMITREWLEEEIVKLETEFAVALGRHKTALSRLRDAKKEADAARESVGGLQGCIRGLRAELDCLDEKEEATP